LFELSLGISRISNFFELGNLTAMFIIVVLKMVEFVMAGQVKRTLTNSTIFIPLHNYIMIAMVYNYCLAICSCFFAFRIFQWLAHYDFFAQATVILNTISRTAPGILVYSILVIIMILAFGIGVHLILGNLY